MIMAPQYNINPDRKYSIAVVGGGIGGLCTAIGLLHQGVPVQIYEAADQFAEIGAGVSFGPNAVQAMKLIDPAIHAGFLKCKTNNASPDKQKVWFSWRKGQDPNNKFGTWIYDTMCETGQASVHRARYLDELIALIPEGVAHFGKRLEHVEDTGQEVILRFADGSAARHSALIGCDGIKSKVRLSLLGDSHPAAHAVFSGKYAYRGLISMADAAKLLGDELARNAQMYVGHGGHILTFPIEHGKTMNVVAFGTKNDGKWEDPDWVKPMDREVMFRDFEGWTESTRSILSLMQKPDVWALFHHLPAPTYFKGRVCILGDAAHASTPHNGAGAGQAVEDALIMSRTIAHVFQSKDIERAFAVFDRVRRPRSQRQVRAAAESGWLYDLQGEGVGDDFEKLKQRLAVQQRFIWEHDVEADVREAVRLFREKKDGPRL
ncbi:FAD/NAD(P)-binding domain-containing protein [Teratosphaeria nubilosa]|uniref:FAD/NAD(P)-binding domain-containing protein n=1 Tax=Teratosphaeria nubilosa TaxID=161662 RepID=A0A6G1L076_9PEZI|nr:FAD/NAD(P)-binding domain-containing protein [Teratosphaeria nubilosa]